MNASQSGRTMVRCLLNDAATVVQTEHGISRVMGPGINVHFGDEPPVKLKAALETAANTVFDFYAKRNTRPHLTQQQLAELSVKIAVHFLYMYSHWRRTNEKHRHLKLALQSGDLDHVQAHDACYHYCREHLGRSYRTAAAALMGKSMRDLKAYEDARKRFAAR